MGLLLVGLIGIFSAAIHPAEMIPFTRYSNYIWLPVRVNGSEPLQFALDSGASSSVISTRAADHLKLQVKAERPDLKLGYGRVEPDGGAR